MNNKDPFFKKKVWLSKPLKGWHYISVWRSPGSPPNELRYAFAYHYGASVPYKFDIWVEDPYVKGCYKSIDECVTSAIVWIKEDADE